MKDVKEFLIKNGFNDITGIDPGGCIAYSNDKCIIEIEDGVYFVTNYNGSQMYSKDLNIYWLIGVLTYYEYLDKNYNQ